MPKLGDFRLSGIHYELHYLCENYNRIDEQIKRLTHKAEEDLMSRYDEDEEYLAASEFHHDATVVIPRLIRHSFLVSLYAVYEATVREIADIIREMQSQLKRLDDLGGAFPKNARKYYHDVLCFPLTRDDASWQKICKLSVLRHVLVHTNGRIDRVRSGDDKARLRQMERTGEIDVDGPDLIIVKAALLEDIFVAVRDDLSDLVSRYEKCAAERRGSSNERIRHDRQ